MIATDFISLLPLIVLTGTSLVVLLAIAIHRNHLLTVWLTLAGLAAAFVVLPVSATVGERHVTAILLIDGYALFFMGLIIAGTFAVAVLSYGYMKKYQAENDEFYLLLLLATLGSAVLVASTHFVSFFLGLELLSVSLYTMIAFLGTRDLGIEGGLKYLVLAAVSSAFLLFGMALVYAELGTMEFSRIAAQLAGNNNAVLVVAGFAMIIVGIGFKLAVVPFHMWTPDVYQGAPAPATAFIASVSKGAVFALLFRLFTQFDVYQYPSLVVIFSIIAIASMFAGNLLALLQNNVKRILAYSSIAHLGYLLVAFLAGGDAGIEAAAYYLVAYFITSIGAFGVVTVLSDTDGEAEELEHYRSLVYEKPWITTFFTSMLLSLASIPLTVGFIGKFFIFTAGVSSALWALVIILVVNSAIGLYYYLKIIITMFSPPKEEGAKALRLPASLSLSGGIVLTVLTVLIFWLGVYPTPLVGMIRTMITNLMF